MITPLTTIEDNSDGLDPKMTIVIKETRLAIRELPRRKAKILNDVIIFLQGGLGNQLFQFNFGELIRQSFSLEVGYSTSPYQTDKYRRKPLLLELGLISPHQLFATWNPHGFVGKFHRLMGNVYTESEWQDHPLCLSEIRNITNSRKNKFLGYWQGYPLHDTIVDRIASVLGAESQLPIGRVLVHARSFSEYGVGREKYRPSLDYFISARDYLEGILVKPSLEVYSDELEYAELIVDALGPSAVAVEKSMSERLSPSDLLKTWASYKHMVLSPSTLSYWAGILGTTRAANILYPKTPETAFSKNLPSEWTVL